MVYSSYTYFLYSCLDPLAILLGLVDPPPYYFNIYLQSTTDCTFLTAYKLGYGFNIIGSVLVHYPIYPSSIGLSADELMHTVTGEFDRRGLCSKGATKEEDEAFYSNEGKGGRAEEVRRGMSSASTATRWAIMRPIAGQKEAGRQGRDHREGE